MTEKYEFLNYLSKTKRSNGRNYKESTIRTYADSIALITIDLNNHLKSNINSLYEVKDIKQLQQLFDKLYNIPKIKQEEITQRQRKTNAFKRYIEFRRNTLDLNLYQNQPDLLDVEYAVTEGNKRVVIMLKPERKGKLRTLAIAIHGLVCFGCGFNFKRMYGNLGDDFIEIHHLQLLSRNTVPIKTNPKTDLIPLCSNCHRMVHRKRGYVLSLAELQSVINL